MSNIKYRSGDFTVATAVGGIRHESPLLPFLNEVIIFHQDFVQLEANFVALDYNTPHPTINPTAYLINESPREDFGGNCVRWTRTYARVPSTYDMPGGSTQFEFPAFQPGRQTIVLTADITVHREFFLCGNHGVFPEWQDIPVNPALAPYNSGDITLRTDTLSSTTTPSLAVYKAWVNSGTPIQIESSRIYSAFGSIFVRDDLFVNAQ